MFHHALITTSALLAAHAASAITITEPKLGDKLDLSGSNTVAWTTVDTDPVSFEIVLVSPSNSTVAQTVITPSVNATENKYTFSNIVTPARDSYQLNFLGNVGTNRGIISQSQTFAVTKSGVKSTTTGTSSAGAGAATGTGTAAGASASASKSGASSAREVTSGFGIVGTVIATLGVLL